MFSATPSHLAEVEQTKINKTGESWIILYLEHLYAQLPRAYLNHDIKSVLELYRQRL
jgi:hypothetical protein